MPGILVFLRSVSGQSVDSLIYEMKMDESTLKKFYKCWEMTVPRLSDAFGIFFIFHLDFFALSKIIFIFKMQSSRTVEWLQPVPLNLKLIHTKLICLFTQLSQTETLAWTRSRLVSRKIATRMQYRRGKRLFRIS